MIKRIISLFFIGMLSTSSMLHSLHLSVINLDYNDELRSFLITLNIHTQDLNDAIYLENKLNLNLGKAEELANSPEMISKYVQNNFILYFDKQPDKKQQLQFVEKKTEDDSTILIYKLSKPDKCKSISIKSTLLTGAFPDQKNLIILNINNKSDGAELNKNKDFCTFTL